MIILMTLKMTAVDLIVTMKQATEQRKTSTPCFTQKEEFCNNMSGSSAVLHNVLHTKPTFPKKQETMGELGIKVGLLEQRGLLEKTNILNFDPCQRLSYEIFSICNQLERNRPNPIVLGIK